jgi:hypothetical protein
MIIKNEKIRWEETERSKFQTYTDLTGLEKNQFLHMLDDEKFNLGEQPKYNQLTKFMEIIHILNKFNSVWNEFYAELSMPSDIIRFITKLYFVMEIYPIPSRIMFHTNTYINEKRENSKFYNFYNKINWNWRNYTYYWRFCDIFLGEEFRIIKNVK